MKSQSGSITVFSTIALVLISASVFALLEGTRYHELHRLADLQTNVALDAAFANYNSCLWEDYHLLAVDYSTVKETLSDISNAKSNERGINLLRLKREETSIESHTRLTDGDGVAYINSISAYMKNYFLYETIKEIYNQYESVKSIMDTNQMERESIGEALERIESLESVEENSTGMAGTKSPNGKQEAHSILKTAQQWMEMGVLELVLEDTKGLSTAESKFENGLLKRELNKGVNSIQKEILWEDRILLQQYLRTYMSCYLDVKENRALDYEVEYLLEERESDIKNLEGVVNRLLVVREAANFLHLISNPQKSTKAEGLAALLVGGSLNPIIIQAVKIGILTAWALAESILDVRALLQGKRIVFIKSDESWTTELDSVEEITTEFAIAKESPWGLGYEDYLGLFLLMEKDEEVAMRALQIQEETIRKKSNDVSFRMDELVTQVQASVLYSYQPIFPIWGFEDELSDFQRKIFSRKTYGYY